MFFSSIIKAIPFLLQVLLVVAAVAIFAFFDPFGIFIQTRQKLKDTPVDVRSIREIGELITAEYYGEVIGSYAHEVEQRQDTSRQIFYQVMGNNHYLRHLHPGHHLHRHLHHHLYNKKVKMKIQNLTLEKGSGIIFRA